MTGRGTILVADDNDALRSLLESILSREGYRVVEAADAEDAVRLLREEEIDAALLDVRLGADDGVALGRQLRLERPSLPIALMSGSISVAEVRKRGADLTDVYLAKPFAVEAVTTIVEQLLDGA
jgi:two-component system cell cycle sensor histidine kinase/response regulator CckA